MAGKGFDAKAFLVNHTEKLILGAAVLTVLAFMGGAQWSPYKGTPAEITEKVEVADKALLGHNWPQEEIDKYKMTQDKFPAQRVNDFLLKPISAHLYAFSTKFVTSPWQGKEPLSEPTLMKLENALADAGKVLIERPSDPSKLLEEGQKSDPNNPGVDQPSGPTTEPAATEEDDEFATGRNNNFGGTAGLGAGHDDNESSIGALGPPGAIPGKPPRNPATRGAGPKKSKKKDDNQIAGLGLGLGLGGEGGLGAGLRNGGGEGGLGAGDGMGLGGSARVEREAQPYKFAIVRAVFPLKEQISKFMQATNSPSMEMASQFFEVIDFNLERQEQIGHTVNWSEWEPVDTQVAIDVLDQSAPVEPDVVRGTVTDSVMTMPLPPRIYGRWNKIASHPRITNFELSPEEIQQEVMLNNELMKMKEEQDKEQVPDARPKPQKKGFSSFTQDARSLQSGMFAQGGMDGDGFGLGRGGGVGMNPAAMEGKGGRNGGKGNRPGMTGNTPEAVKAEQLAKLMERFTNSKDPTEKNKALEEFIKKSVNADGELLLFRYLDFDVDPGKTYRYRVRLILNNPNFGHLASEANGEAGVVEGETRPTEWSNVTKPVTIEKDVYYFVKDVDNKRGKTLMSVYEWDTKLGTTVHADLDVYPGQHIGGSAETNVIDPAKSVAEVKKYTFKSPDVFVDTRSDVSLDRTLHKDLKLPGGSNGDALLPEEALVVQAITGELAVIDPIRQAAEQSLVSKKQKLQDESFAWLSQSAAAVPGAAGLMSGDGESDYGGAARTRNPLAAGKGRGAAGQQRKTRKEDRE